MCWWICLSEIVILPDFWPLRRVMFLVIVFFWKRDTLYFKCLIDVGVTFQIDQRINHLQQQLNNNDNEPEHRSLDNGDHVSSIYLSIAISPIMTWVKNHFSQIKQKFAFRGGWCGTLMVVLHYTPMGMSHHSISDLWAITDKFLMEKPIITLWPGIESRPTRLRPSS